MKRFTDTGKWAKQWYQDLSPRLKCLWQFLCDAADAAGVWEPNFKLASFQIGEPVGEADLAHFGDRLGRTFDGKIIINSFTAFQYGKLSEDCKAHIPVFRALEKHRLSIGYPKAIHSLQETEEDKDKETERGSREGGEKPESQPDSEKARKDIDRYNAKQLLSFLNESAGTQFREIDTNIDLIAARLAEKDVKPEEVEVMIERQVLLWRDTDMAEYLQPSTLFGKTKFQGYYDKRRLPVARQKPKAQPFS